MSSCFNGNYLNKMNNAARIKALQWVECMKSPTLNTQMMLLKKGQLTQK